MTGSLATRGLYCNTQGAAPYTSGVFCPGVTPAAVKICLFGSLPTITGELSAGLEQQTAVLSADLATATTQLSAGLEEQGELEATLAETGALSASLEDCY
jgi:hypothetical protein